jgi:hypothetical protein
MREKKVGRQNEKANPEKIGDEKLDEKLDGESLEYSSNVKCVKEIIGTKIVRIEGKVVSFGYKVKHFGGEIEEREFIIANCE